MVFLGHFSASLYIFEQLLVELSRSLKFITVVLWSKAVIAAVGFVAHLHFSPLGVDGRIELDIIGNCYCIRGADMFLGPLGDLVSYGQLLTALGVFDSSGHHLTGTGSSWQILEALGSSG